MSAEDTLLLVDLSGMVHQCWHVSGKEPDPDWTSQQVVARVRALASGYPHAAICCDSGRSFRHEVDPTYKATRPESNAPLLHQMQLAIDALKADGFPCWSVKGFEADDIIATATKQALACDGDVLIASSDKDLLALVGPNVRVKSLTSGNVLDEAAVLNKMKVRPDQIADYLALVGDKADNVVGAKGIGDVNAAKLLAEWGSIEGMYKSVDTGLLTVTPSITNSLIEFRDRWPVVRQLIALRSDVEIPFAEIAAERTPPPMDAAPVVTQAATVTSGGAATSASTTFNVVNGPNDSAQGIIPGTTTHGPRNGTEFVTGMTTVSNDGVPYGMQLEPRSMTEARMLAEDMFKSRLFSAYGTAQGVLATVLAGRELGMGAMTSLRAFHIIEGKPQLSAGTIQALVLKSGKATYFRCSERTANHATFVTRRGDDPETALTFTLAEGRAAWAKDEKAWLASGWGRNPADMCVARCATKLARLVYPDVVANLYAPEEMG